MLPVNARIPWFCQLPGSFKQINHLMLSLQVFLNIVPVPTMLTFLKRIFYYNYLFKPSVDGRYSSNEVVTHSGFRLPAASVSDGA